MEGDTCLGGRHAEFETYKKSIWLEARARLGYTTVNILFDQQAFYDTIDTESLLHILRELGAPPEATSIALQGHIAPRRLKQAGNFSDTIHSCGRSIVAGCTSSTTFARAYLKAALQLARNAYIQSELPMDDFYQGIHVDDVSQAVAHHDPGIAARLAIHAASSFAEGVLERHLVISNKTVVLSNKPKVATRVKNALKREGIPIKTARAANDLGVETTCAKSRASNTIKMRFAKGIKRMRRGKILARFCSRQVADQS